MLRSLVFSCLLCLLAPLLLLAQPAPESVAAATLNNIDPALLNSVPPECITAGSPIATACGDELRATSNSTNVSQYTVQQIAQYLRREGLSPSCCQAISVLIDNGCACNKAAGQLIAAFGLGSFVQGLTVAFPDVCGRKGADCIQVPAAEELAPMAEGMMMAPAGGMMA